MFKLAVVVVTCTPRASIIHALTQLTRDEPFDSANQQQLIDGHRSSTSLCNQSLSPVAFSHCSAIHSNRAIFLFVLLNNSDGAQQRAPPARSLCVQSTAAGCRRASPFLSFDFKQNCTNQNKNSSLIHGIEWNLGRLHHLPAAPLICLPDFTTTTTTSTSTSTTSTTSTVQKSNIII